MKKYQLNNIDDLFIGSNPNIFFRHFAYIENYIKTTIISYLYFKLPRSYELTIDNNYYISIDCKSYYKALCKLLNINYVDINEENIKEYYMVQYQNKLATLRNIKSEEELTYSFPELNTFYQKKKQDIEEATKLYYTIYRLFPKEEAEYIKKKTLIKNDFTESKYIELLNESQVFDFQYFINRVIQDLNNLLSNESIINNMINDCTINLNTLNNINTNELKQYKR